MTATCPQGHHSSTDDFCDVCGAPIAPAGTPSGPAGAEAVPPPVTPPQGSSLDLDPPTPAPLRTCPQCGTENPADAVFCEACGCDFTTGAMPPVPAAAPDPGAAWVAEIWIDPDWFSFQDSPGGCATSGAPTVVPLRGATALIGRPSRSRGLVPEIDCTTDGAVSHSHARLTLDHDRWSVEDLGSTNGTFVGTPGAPLPTMPLEPRQRHELADDERIYVGSWTRIMVRLATADERAGDF
jgi:hypothetical protein